MGQIFKIQEKSRDEELGLIKKQITCDSSSLCFDSPIVSQRANKSDPDIKVQEIIRHIDDKVVDSLITRHIKPFADAAKYEFASDKLNATLFDFRFNDFPSDDNLRVIAHALHGASDKVIFLPTVKKALLMGARPGLKTPSLSLDRIESYKKMMKLIIDETRVPKNGKEIVGMVPFLPSKFARPIIDFYASEGIRIFALDCGFIDIMDYEDDFAYLLSTIKKSVVPLEQTVIFAFNAGIGSTYEATELVSDDFLSVFAYVDVLGSTFKQRGGGKSVPRAKVFSRDKYAYDIWRYPDLRPQFGKYVSFLTIRNFNKSEQLKETAKVRDLVGVDKIKKYLATKPAVKQDSMKHLESIAQKVG
jgi:hypothetical protein